MVFGRLWGVVASEPIVGLVSTYICRYAPSTAPPRSSRYQNFDFRSRYLRDRGYSRVCCLSRCSRFSRNPPSSRHTPAERPSTGRLLRLLFPLLRARDLPRARVHAAIDPFLHVDSPQQHQQQLSVLQQCFEDLQAEHDQTLRRLRDLQAGGSASTPLSSSALASRSLPLASSLQSAGAGVAGPPGPGGLVVSKSSSSPDGGERDAQLAEKDAQLAEKDEEIDELKEQVTGLYRDIDKLIREKEEFFFERENFVDRRMVLTMAAQLQSEPNPLLKVGPVAFGSSRANRSLVVVLLPGWIICSSILLVDNIISM